MRNLCANIMALLFLPIVAVLLTISLTLRIMACTFITIIPCIDKGNGWKFVIKAYNALSNMYK